MSTYPDDDDGAVLASLAEHGVDMSQPLTIEFAVAVPDEESAQAAEKVISKAGYETSVEYDEGEPNEDGEIDPEDEDFGSSWTVLAKVQMVPEYDEIIRIQDELDKMAHPFGGCSDGWGVMLDGEDE